MIAHLLPSQVAQEEGKDSDWWLRITDELIEQSRRGTSADLLPLVPTYIEWVDTCARRVSLCEPHRLTTFVQEFARVASNVGEPDGATESVLRAIDNAIRLTDDDTAVLAQLWRAKAIYFRTRSTESPPRLEALNTALKLTEVGSPEWTSTLIDLSEYFVEASRYSEAIRAAEQIEHKGREIARSSKFRIGVATAKGVALFTSFQNMRGQIATSISP
jgi:hypothetical protein